MSRRTFFTALFCLFAAWPVHAHDLQHSVEGAPAIVIKLFYLDNHPFAFEAYEIYREGEKLPYQVGRTDSQGRIAFLPDRAGAWRVKAFSEDGHGLDFKLETDAAAALTGSEKPAFERYGRVAVGVAIILGLFGLLSLYVKRKNPK
ncbi:MAG: ABC transporter permease [Thiobacillaceae bacterium]|jgi:nickel transport protein|nr:ABC transporter permease [Thiobacillaceae bacterium]